MASSKFPQLAPTMFIGALLAANVAGRKDAKDGLAPSDRKQVRQVVPLECAQSRPDDNLILSVGDLT